MIEITDMTDQAVDDLLSRIGYGHFACAWDRQPYVVPINYAYEKPYILIYTTAGLKSEIIKRNPLVSLQVEEIMDDGTWKSVVVTGEAVPITDPTEREQAVEAVRKINPTLLPVVALRWTDEWIKEKIEVVYKITVKTATGLSSSHVRMVAAAARPVAAVIPQ